MTDPTRSDELDRLRAENAELRLLIAGARALLREVVRPNRPSPAGHDHN